jgi:hypothetical protein
MHRFATVVLAAALLSTAFLTDADAGPFRHRRSCCPSSYNECCQPANACGECCQPANVCGEIGIPPCVLYVCDGGSYKNAGTYNLASDAHYAGMKYKSGKDALHYVRCTSNPPTGSCNKTFTVCGFCVDGAVLNLSVDLFYCQNSVWTYIGTFYNPALAQQQAWKDLGQNAVEANCSGTPGPGDYTICGVGNTVNGTPCMKSLLTPGAKQSEPKHP